MNVPQQSEHGDALYDQTDAVDPNFTQRSWAFMTSSCCKANPSISNPDRSRCRVAMWRGLAPISIGLLVMGIPLASGCTSPVAPAHDAAAPSVPLTETDWRCSRIGTRVLPAESAPTLLITSKGHASGFAGVNRWSGPCTVDGSAMKFGMLIMTRMAGSPERMELEQAYANALAAVKQWSVVEGRLQCSDGTSITMEFVPAG